MSELTDAVEALSAGVVAQGEALSGALGRIQEDFSAIQAKLDAALADDAEAKAAVQRIQENLGLMQQTTDALVNLDVDPNNPQVPLPSPPVDSGPPTPSEGSGAV